MGLHVTLNRIITSAFQSEVLAVSQMFTAAGCKVVCAAQTVLAFAATMVDTITMMTAY